ncbi:MAG: DUF3866 family protein, partial [Tissierellales bacterium]
HIGISHHTRTVLSEIVKTTGTVVIPVLDDEKLKIINEQINMLKLDNKFDIVYENGDEILDAMNYFNLRTTTMGRGYHEDKEFFLTMGAVGSYVAKKFMKEE